MENSSSLKIRIEMLSLKTQIVFLKWRLLFAEEN